MVRPKPKLSDIVSLWEYKSEVITRAPVRLAKTLKMRPIGPCPMTSTLSSGSSRRLTTPFMHVFTGSTKQPCS